jgi:hypothetical protein
MKILFYGGCHGSALRRIAEQFDTGAHQLDHLTNFVMIQRGEPFPYDYAAGFDLIIFSPILKKGDWNTDRLEAFCETRKIAFIKYPWIEWSGYFPGMEKMDFGWHSEWWNMALRNEAARFERFDQFYEAVLDGDILAEEARANRTFTTDYLRGFEVNTHVGIVDFLEENHQRERLMLTPDHAATSVYKHVYRQIEAMAGRIVDPGFYHTAFEIQAGMEAPIIPSVARALGLQFAGSDYRNTLFAGNALIILRDYLRLQFFAPRIARATAKTNTRAKLALDNPESFVSIPMKEAFIVELTGEMRSDHVRTRIISPANAVRARSANLSGSEQWLYSKHWDLTPMWPA